MPSSISNSKVLSWIKSWVLALLIAALLLAGLEVFWRAHGHRPAIVDDQRLWAMERDKVGRAENEIVLLGSSRMQTDTSTATLHRLAPEYSIINIPADSTCANATLRDLAEDSNFKGIAIVETTSECLMFGDESELSQQFYVNYYHRVYNFNVKANRIIATFLQKIITIMDPYLNLLKVAGDKIIKKKWRTPNYVTTHEDRSRLADYTKLDLASHKALRLQKVTTHYRLLSPHISTRLLTQQVARLDDAVRKIENRGGKVAFIRFPVSNEHWIIDEEYFPREIYWDRIIHSTSAEIIHFKDVEGMNRLQCPDTSHLDTRDTAIFTEQLFAELSKKKMF